MPNQGVVHVGEDAEPNGAVRDQSHVLPTPHPKAVPYPLQDLVKSWVSCEAHTQTSRLNIMKWLVLQLLTLYCLVITPVTGSMKEKRIVTKPQQYSRYFS